MIRSSHAPACVDGCFPRLGNGSPQDRVLGDGVVIELKSADGSQHMRALVVGDWAACVERVVGISSLHDMKHDSLNCGDNEL